MNPVRLLKYLFKKHTNSTFEHELLAGPSCIQEKGERLGEHMFTGGPVALFEKVGRLQLITLLKLGLCPESIVLDVGCGALRGGYWLIHFLLPGSYHGIEPNRKMVAAGLQHILDKDTYAIKKPYFDFNDTFDFSVFNKKFDFIVARSIWTHASKQQILRMLNEFISVAKPNAIFLTSYLAPYSPKEEYFGEDWIGMSHESDKGGVAFHSFSWILKVCTEKSLIVKELDFDVINNQKWLVIKKKNQPMIGLV